MSMYKYRIDNTIITSEEWKALVRAISHERGFSRMCGDEKEHDMLLDLQVKMMTHSVWIDTPETEEGMGLFFTSDHHFGHANIIRYCDRPFSSTEEMEEEMSRKWNEIVGPKDIVYHLGDFTLGGLEDAMRYFSMLNGEVRILDGTTHHDSRWMDDAYSMAKPIGTKTNHVLTLSRMTVLERVAEVPIVLCHFPFAIWDRKHYGAIHLHGHSHCQYQAPGRIMDVGVDCNDFYPVSLEQVLEKTLPIKEGLL